ncbi:acyl-CoA:lysophosphatidylglycerol acyltransferase 1-like [Amphibalanus amphitrite]|uniref:acyl-CoA:lysophosphatidylglycerol acyltransferase 1-like n=1 Tax=Amphibalanus amphitrite TaxID=1232801 RepID=UPI001C90DDDB|nr:acyl-CoA:lysophosphatidylglycerol acyltransferase 1-like [Amphibalanus amphitrite]
MDSKLRRYARGAWGVTRVLLFLVNNLYAIPVYLVWMAMLSPLNWLAPAFYWAMEGFLFHSLVLFAGVLSYTAGFDLVELGDSISDLESERCLLLANHQSTGDVPLLMTMLSARRRAADNVLWIMDAMFKWTHFGMVSQVRGDFFVESGKEKRDKSVQELREQMPRNYLSLDRKWIILFPEGGFLWKRRAASQRFAEKQGLPHIQHVTLPRLGAAQAVLEKLGPTARGKENHCNGHGDQNGAGSARPSLRWVVDVTIAYPEADRPLDLLAVMAGNRPPCNVLMYYRVYDIDQVPTDTEGLTSWLYKLFIEKDAALSEHYRTGRMPELPGGRRPDDQPSPPPRKLRQDLLEWALRQAFFLASVVVQWRAARLLWGWVGAAAALVV